MATGLYSKNTEISILKSGWSVAKGYPHDFLPNDDGTYQIRLSVDAKKSEIDDYGCEVNQGDQKTTLVAQWAKGEITLLGYAFQFTTGTLQIRVYLYHKENRICILNDHSVISVVYFMKLNTNNLMALTAF